MTSLNPYQVRVCDDFEDCAKLEVLYEMLLCHSLHFCQKELVAGRQKIFGVILDFFDLLVEDYLLFLQWPPA